MRSAFRTKALNGEYTGGYPTYGYRKDPEDRHRLIPDEHAPIVQRMFQMALEGTTCFHIAKTLEDEEIPTPRAYLMDAIGKCHANERVKHPYAWAKTTVHQILSNPIYLGKLVSQRYKTKSFKDKRIVPRPEDEWITVKISIICPYYHRREYQATAFFAVVRGLYPETCGYIISLLSQTAYAIIITSS